MDRKRKLGLAAFLLVFISAAIISSLPTDSGPATELPSFQLSDGRVLRVEGVSVGHRHELRNGSDLRKRIQDWLPRPVRDLLGPEVVKISTSTSESTLIPFVSIDKVPGGRSPQWSNWRVLSEAGEVFESGSWSSGRNYKGRSLAYPRLPVFPRRDRTLLLTGTVDRLPFSITLPNPIAATNFPVWQPDPPGRTNRQGGYDFVLEGDTSIYVNRGWNSIRTKLGIYKDGQAVNDWFRSSFQISDATGNRGYRIPTNEPAWKIEFTIRREYPAPWDPKEYHDLVLGDLPEDATYRDLGSGLTINGITLGQMWLGGPGEFTMANRIITNAVPYGTTGRRGSSTSSSGSGNWKMEWGKDKPWIMFEVPTLPSGMTFSVFLVDSEGRDHTSTYSGGMSGGSFRVRYFDLKLPKEFTPPYTARLAMQTNLHAHFIVDPTKLKRTGPKRRNKR